MLHPELNLIPKSVGKYKNHNDTRYASEDKPYQPQEQTFRGQPIPPPSPPLIVIIDRKDIWYYVYWNLLKNSLLHTHPQPTASYHPAQPQKQKDKEKDKASKLGAMFFFAALLFGAGVAVAYGAVESKKIAENLLAGRKRITNLIKLTWAGLFGFALTVNGVQLGAYYGSALFGSAAVGAGLGGVLLGLIGISAGLLAGKYAAKACTYVYTRFKSTNSDPYSLRPSVANKIEEENFKTHIQNLPKSHRPNLMLGYLVNKIEFAKQNKFNPKRIESLESFRQALKLGQYPKELKDYFDNEFKMVRTEWYAKKSHPMDQDQRFNDTADADIENDFLALAVISSQLNIWQNDKYPELKAVLNNASAPGFDDSLPSNASASGFDNPLPSYHQKSPTYIPGGGPYTNNYPENSGVTDSNLYTQPERGNLYPNLNHNRRF